MRSLVLVVIILLFSALSGCLESTVDNDPIDPPEDDVSPPSDVDNNTTILPQAEVFYDVVYANASTSDLLLDIYIPSGEGPHPLFVNIHGGGWAAGDKALHNESAAMQLYDSGNGAWAVASINYRLTNEAVWPAQIEDTKAKGGKQSKFSKKMNEMMEAQKESGNRRARRMDK